MVGTSEWVLVGIRDQGLNVHASGQMYEDKTIVINIVYDGEAETTERDFMIHGDNIRMAATRN